MTWSIGASRQALKRPFVEEDRGSSPFDILFSRSIPAVLADIFLMVEPQDLDSCRAVCKRWCSFIDFHVLGVPSLRERVLARRVALLWKRENFVEHTLEKKGIKWNELDIDGACCVGKDVFMAAGDVLLHFRDFKLVQSTVFREGEKVKIFWAGSKCILVLMSNGHSHAVLRRDTLEVVGRFRSDSPLDRDAVHLVDWDQIYVMRPSKEKTGKTSLRVGRVRDSDGEEEAVAELTAERDIARREDGTELDDLSTCTKLMNRDFIYMGHPSGQIDLVPFGSCKEENGRSPMRVRYSPAGGGECFIKRGVLTRTYFGAVFHRSGSPACSFSLFSTADGSPLASADDLEVYGRVYFSATDRHFAFSYADALHNQHFIVHDFAGRLSSSQQQQAKGKVVVKKFVLDDRPHPMRSMQILRDRLLILSFYRTASALNVFDLTSILSGEKVGDRGEEGAGFDPEREERVLKLPVGVIAFQSSHDDCNSQKLVMYREVGVLCQRLDYSSENLIFALRFLGSSSSSGDKGQHQQHQHPVPSSSSVFRKAMVTPSSVPPLIRSAELSLKKYKFRLMGEQFASRRRQQQQQQDKYNKFPIPSRGETKT